MAITNEENSKITPGTAITKKVEVVPYDPAWQAHFDKLQQYLLGTLTGQNVRVEHVGSTSVPGLAAKPILDIDIVLQNGTDFGQVKVALESRGYYHIGDLGISGREVFKYENKPQFMSHHLYVLSEDSEELKRHLTFRDWLRSHPEDRELYANTKLMAAQKFPDDIGAYIDAKSDIIFDIYHRCGLYQPQSLLELSASVANNRYNLRVRDIDCKPIQTGVSMCLVQTEQGTYCLLAWEKAGPSSGEISLAQNPAESTKARPLPTASGQPLCATPFATFALFASEQDALTFLTSNAWHHTANF
ncbi:MAG TPA: GrpB family protein [Anaerolineaceae bacterium]|nr:GrpB family protein [Anaerolineaceae bacterium]